MPKRAQRPITTTVIRSIEPIDLDEWMYRYAVAIVEAKGTGPESGPSTPTASTVSPEAAYRAL